MSEFNVQFSTLLFGTGCREYVYPLKMKKTYGSVDEGVGGGRAEQSGVRGGGGSERGDGGGERGRCEIDRHLVPMNKSDVSGHRHHTVDVKYLLLLTVVEVTHSNTGDTLI